MSNYDTWKTTEPQQVVDAPTLVCRCCNLRSETVCPDDGLCADCWSPNPYGVDDDYDDSESEPPLDDSGPRSNGRIFL